MLFRNGPWIILVFVLAALYLIFTLDHNTHELAKVPDQTIKDDKTRIGQTTLPKTGKEGVIHKLCKAFFVVFRPSGSVIPTCVIPLCPNPNALAKQKYCKDIVKVLKDHFLMIAITIALIHDYVKCLIN